MQKYGCDFTLNSKRIFRSLISFTLTKRDARHVRGCTWLHVAVGMCAVLLRFRSFQTVFGRRPFLKDASTDLAKTVRNDMKRHETTWKHSVLSNTASDSLCHWRLYVYSAWGGLRLRQPNRQTCLQWVRLRIWIPYDKKHIAKTWMKTFQACSRG